MEDFARDELQNLPGRVNPRLESKPGNLPFTYSGDLDDLLKLRIAGSVYLVRHFAVPRPLALLGHQNFQQLLGDIRQVMALHSPGSFSTVRISAAGENSSVYDRLRAEISVATKLSPSFGEGDLLLRIRRPTDIAEGFQVSVRLSPRPLSTRPWRVCDMPGALNAPVARVMVQLTEPRPDDFFLNVACGSGTLLVERLEHSTARRVWGVDTDPDAIGCSRRNLLAAGLAEGVHLEQGDAGNLPLPDACVSAVVTDLPWGHLVGAHSSNAELYPRVLAESARVAMRGAKMVVLTAEARLLDRALREQTESWELERMVRLRLDSIQLRIYVLRRT